MPGWFTQTWVFLSTHHMDPITIVVTIALLPIITGFAFVLKRFFTGVARYIADGLVFSLSRMFFRRLSSSLTLRRYCRLGLAGTSANLHIPNSSSDITVSLDEVFVPLLLEKSLDDRLYDHSNLVELGNRIRIIGDPGSGKSTIAKRLFRDECRMALARKPSRLPILKSNGDPPALPGWQ